MLIILKSEKLKREIMVKRIKIRCKTLVLYRNIKNTDTHTPKKISE